MKTKSSRYEQKVLHHHLQTVPVPQTPQIPPLKKEQKENKKKVINKMFPQTYEKKLVKDNSDASGRKKSHHCLEDIFFQTGNRTLLETDD